jgi:hypothetical protein
MTDRQERATNFIVDSLNHLRSYHKQKETAALTAFTLCTGAFSTALITKDWPPSWGPYSKELCMVSITFVWLAFLIYIKWQLHRRRWAALRMAGAERLLATWISERPSEQDLTKETVEDQQQPLEWREIISRKSRRIAILIIDSVWAIYRAVPVVDVSQAVYPRILVQFWKNQFDSHGTSAIFHERLIVIVGWLLYFAVLVRTYLSALSAPFMDYPPL